MKTLLVIMCLVVSLIPVGIIGSINGFQFIALMLIVLIILITIIVSFFISYFITKPIHELTKNIDQISSGKLDTNLEYSKIYEINNLTDSLNRIMASLKLAIHKIGVKNGEIFEDPVKAKEAFEKKQEDLISSIKGWVWETDANGNIIFCSKNVSKILGYSPDELIGKNLFNFISSEDEKKVKKIYNEASKNKKPIRNLENWYIDKTGRKIWVVTNSVPFFDDYGNFLGFRGVDTDITREKEAESKIIELKTQISNYKMEGTDLLTNIENKSSNQFDMPSDERWSEHKFDSVFIFDENANILDCNKNMYKRLGYSKSEILSLNMSDFDVLESKQEILNKIKKAKKIGVLSIKTIHKRKDGSAFLVSENLQYLKNKNEFKCIVREDFPPKKST